MLLITKTDFDVPSDGGTLRVAAIQHELQVNGFDVDTVSIRTSDGRRRAAVYAAQNISLQGLRSVFPGTSVAAAVARAGSLTVARWYSPAAAAHIGSLVGNNEYSAILIEYSQLLIYRPLFRGASVILDMHNIEHELLGNYTRSTRSALRRVVTSYEASRIRRLERRARKLVDAVITVSAHDANTMQKMPGEATVVTAPNGVSDAAFDVERAPAEIPTIVFIAHLGWRPNIDAAHWLVQNVWPTVHRECPQARLQLIGRSPAKSLTQYDGIDGVTIHPDVPSTLPYLSKAVVATAPLQAAGGTRLKILESMATGTPVVSTSMGALGLEHLATGDGLWIADSPSDFAEVLVQRIMAPVDPAGVRQQVVSYKWTRALKPLVEVLTEKAGICSR